MSRTFRRKGYEDTQGTSWDRKFRKTAGFYTTIDWHYNAHGYWGVGREPTATERAAEFKRVHGDTHRNAWTPSRNTYRKEKIIRNRMYNKGELHKFVYREDYEPLFQAQPYDSWWDWS